MARSPSPTARASASRTPKSPAVGKARAETPPRPSRTPMPAAALRTIAPRIAVARTAIAVTAPANESGPAVPPSRLVNCEVLQPRLDCDAVYYSEILEFIVDDEKKSPVKHPARMIDRAKRVADNWRAMVARARVVAALGADTTGKYAGIPIGALVKHQLRQRAARGRARFDAIAVPPRFRSQPAGRGAGAAQARMLITPAFPGLLRPGVDLGDLIRSVFEDVVIVDLPAALEPTVALRAIYRQDWCSQGYHRGRLLRTIPLTADGKKEIVVKSWQTRKDRREQNTAVAEDISTEFIGDQKWSLATSKEVSANLNQNINANLNADASVTVPVEAVPVKLGAGGSAGSTTAAGVAATMRETEERVTQSTVKAANTLKKSVTSVVETAEEAGTETTVTETIVNPNKCNSLMYDFFEVTETYTITTAIDALEAVLLLPISIPVIDYAWVLCHECLLRKYLPCETYYAGFEGAKRLQIGQNLGQFGGTLDNQRTNDAAQATLDAMSAVIAAYRALADATLSVAPAPGDQGFDLGTAIEDGLNVVKEGWDDAVAATGEVIDDVVTAVGEGVDAIGDAIGGGVQAVAGLFGFGQARMMAPAGRPAALQAQSASGISVGSYIYWEVVKIAAPEIATACAALEAAYNTISTMPAGPAHTDAAYKAAEQFFATIGNVDEAFKKVDVALFVLFASGALAAAIGITALGGLAAAAAVAIGVAAVPAIPILLTAALAFVGTSAPVALAALGSTIAAVLGDQAGSVDLVPRDHGLKAAVSGLYGQFGNLGGSMSLPVAPQSDSPEAIAAYQQQLMELKKEQREMAEALVEFERLKCQLTDNLTYYAQLVTQSYPESSLRDMLDQFGIPPNAVEPRIVGFAGRKVAFRVRDNAWLVQSGIDFDALARQLEKDGFFTANRASVSVTLPTPGVSVEARLGECDACDAFVETHRALDLDLKREELAQAQTENLRRKARVDAGDLEDPVTREAKLALTVTNEAGDGE